MSDEIVPSTFDGKDAVEVVVEGTRHVIGRWCPHQQADLAQGLLLDGAIKCPLHGYLFSLADGRGLNNRFRLDVLASEPASEDAPLPCEGAVPDDATRCA